MEKNMETTTVCGGIWLRVYDTKVPIYPILYLIKSKGDYNLKSSILNLIYPEPCALNPEL